MFDRIWWVNQNGTVSLFSRRLDDTTEELAREMAQTLDGSIFFITRDTTDIFEKEWDFNEYTVIVPT